MLEAIVTAVTLLGFIPIAWPFWTWLWGRIGSKEVKLDCGTFRVKRKNFNAVDLTRIVGSVFFDGGKVDDAIRKQILELTGTGAIDPVKNPDYLRKNAPERPINGGSN